MSFMAYDMALWLSIYFANHDSIIFTYCLTFRPPGTFGRIKNKKQKKSIHFHYQSYNSKYRFILKIIKKYHTKKYYHCLLFN